MKTRPHQHREPVADINILRSYPLGSFGRAWADALEQNSLQPFTFGPRRLQLHDGVHVLLGYGVDSIDEARVQAFLLGTQNRLKPFNWFVLNLLVAKVFQQLNAAQLNTPASRQILFKALWQAYQRGYQSTFNPDRWQPETLWHLPLEQVRASFNL